MSVDQLIAHIRDCSGSHSEQLPAHVGEQVIAVLRAGQGMYDEFKDLPDLFRSSIETRLKRALDGWDAATKGESEV